MEKRVGGDGGEGVEVRLAEHVGLADNARGYADGVDGAVELGVGGGHEHFFEAAAVGEEALVSVLIVFGDGGREKGLSFG